MGGLARIRDETLRRDTGQGYEDWFVVLARWGAVRKGHREAVRFLRAEHGLPKRIAEVIVLAYERDQDEETRGTRADGTHDVRLQRTMLSTPEAAYEAWTRSGHLARWLTTRARNQLRVGGRYEMAGGNRGRYLELDAPRRLRFTWDNERHCPGTEVEVTLNARDEDKVVVRVVHRGLSTKEDEVRMTEVWTMALGHLQTWLEIGRKGDQHLWVTAR